MTIEEIVIYHTLIGKSDSMYVTPDGKNLYFLADNGMLNITFEPGINAHDMTEDELNQMLIDFLTNQ